MISLIKRFTHNQDEKVNSRISKASKVVARPKQQARKTHSDQAVELIWLQSFVDAVAAHKGRMLVVVLMLSLMGLPFVMAKMQWLPIEKIVLSGQFIQLKSDQLEQHLKPFLGKGFFSVDIKSVQIKLAQQPWVEKVSVRRIWPDQLHVSVKEKQAIARWDHTSLLSNRAVIFKQDASGFEHLPKINGYRNQSSELLTRFQNLQTEFKQVDLVINELTEDRKGATSLLLNNQLRINLGSENNESKVRHLIAVYKQKIKPESEHIQYIDFRYSNGFAIAWKKDYSQQRAKTQKRGNRNV